MVEMRGNAGFALLEVLIALVILLIGLLGLMGLQSRMVRAQTETYQREQALVVLQDMIDRINANYATAPCYAVTTGVGRPYLGTGFSGAITCTGYGDVTTQAQAVHDMTEWNELLNGTSETFSGSAAGGLLGARGCITLSDPINKIYNVVVAWQGLDDTAAPTVACGNGRYGPETRRRAVFANLRIANLTAP